MNILMVTTSYPLVPQSSSGIFVRRLKESLDKTCKVEVICPDDARTEQSEQNIVRVRYFLKRWQILAHQPGGIPSAIRRDPRFLLLVPLLLFSMLVSILKRIRSNDIIFANWAINALVASIPSVLFNKPMVTTFRGEDVRKLDGRLQSFIVWFALWASDAVVLVSEDMRAPLIRRFPDYERKIRVIHNGVDSNFFAANIASDINSKDEIRILSVASLIPRKNIDTLIKALVYLKKTFPGTQNIKLDIVGDGELYSKLSKLSNKEGIGDDVRFHGMLAPNKLVDLFSQSQLFVLPSLYEGRPNVVVEAMAAGCCVLVSDIDGCRELISNNENGLTFPACDEKVLGQAIYRVATDKQLRSFLGASARKYVVDHKLTWEGCADQYCQLFEPLTNKGRC